MDHYTLGILAFELLARYLTLTDRKPAFNFMTSFEEIKLKDYSGFRNSLQQSIEDEAARDFITSLVEDGIPTFEADQSKRLGTQGGLQDILSHPWLGLSSGSIDQLVADRFEDVRKENVEFFHLAELLDNSRNDQLMDSDDSFDGPVDDPFGDF